jgi:hypothetical protein
MIPIRDGLQMTPQKPHRPCPCIRCGFSVVNRRTRVVEERMVSSGIDVILETLSQLLEFSFELMDN